MKVLYIDVSFYLLKIPFANRNRIWPFFLFYLNARARPIKKVKRDVFVEHNVHGHT